MIILESLELVQHYLKETLVVFDHFTVPSSDNGDVFTVLSYDSERYSRDIPRIGKRNIRASDVLDFRPRVSEFTSTTASPFDFTSRNFYISISQNFTCT